MNPYYCPNCGTQGTCKTQGLIATGHTIYHCVSCKFKFSMKGEK